MYRPPKNIPKISSLIFLDHFILLFSSLFSPCHEVFLSQNEPQPAESHQDSVAEITEHNGEEERERDDGIRSGVQFPVGGNTVRVNDSLERYRNLFFEEILTWKTAVNLLVSL